MDFQSPLAYAAGTIRGCGSNDAGGAVRIDVHGDAGDHVTDVRLTVGFAATYRIGLPLGDYRMVPSRLDLTFQPSERLVDLRAGDLASLDFCYGKK